VLVIIPAWNEEETVAATVREVFASAPYADLVVVNDGSTDRTAQVARAAGAAVIDLPVNLGVGGAMRAGYKHAFRSGYDITVQIDADGQHDPTELAKLVQTLDSEGADIVIGARFAGTGGYAIRGPRRWTMQILSRVLSRVAGTKLTDTTSGFKACSRQAIALFATNYPAEYLGDTIEALVIASRARMVIRQVPVAMRPRAGGRPSHSPLRSAAFLARAMLALLVALSRPSEPVPAGVA
jgi:glycosyltransferase involved in cell wall biosynthesis